MNVVTDEGSLAKYLSTLAEECRHEFYVSRHLQTSADWERMAVSGYRGSAFSEYHPTLDGLLSRPRLIVLGEPGSGKSTVAKEAVQEAIRRNWLPVFGRLKLFEGALDETFFGSLPAEAADPAMIKLYVLDGFDEIAEPHFASLSYALAQLEKADPNARFLITSRQAFFVSRKSMLGRAWPEFYLDDLNSEDKDAFCERAGVNRDHFRQALHASSLEYEAGNPFVLGALLAIFAERRHLPETRSETLRELIDLTLAREAVPLQQQKDRRRGLRMLAVVMETYAHNELTPDQAVTALRGGLRMQSDDQARQMLSDLTHTILVQGPKGFGFQMRSYGEYLAAEELAQIDDATKVMSLIYVQGTRTPSASWQNCLAYLIELHPHIRRIMVAQHPELTLTSAPSKFTAADRTRIATHILEDVKGRQEYLVFHPTIRAYLLSRFITPQVTALLLVDLNGVNEVATANAAVCLGAAEYKPSADVIFAIAQDPSRPRLVRYSALSGLSRVGTSEMVPALLKDDGSDDDFQTSRLHTAAALMGVDQFYEILKSLCGTKTLVSSAYERFDSLSSPDEVDAALTAAAALEGSDPDQRLDSYLRPIWRAGIRHWRPEWAKPLALTLTQLDKECRRRSIGLDLIKMVERAPAIRESAGEHLADIALAGDPYSRLDVSAYKLIGVSTAARVRDTAGSERLIQSLRAFGRPEIQTALGPAPSVEPEDPEVLEWKKQDLEREATKDKWITQAKTGASGNDVLIALNHLDPKQWPHLDSLRIEQLAAVVSQKLVECDLRNSIKWLSDTEWQSPRVLSLLIKAVDHYELVLADERPLVWATCGFEHGAAVKYYKRRGLSAQAIAIAAESIGDATLHEQALCGLLGFWRESELPNERAIEESQVIAQGVRSDRAKDLAVNYLIGVADDSVLVSLSSVAKGDLVSTLELALIKRGHRPTVARRLASLRKDLTSLDAGEVEFPKDSSLAWISSVQGSEFWKPLVALRRAALQRGLFGVSMLFSDALGRIDLIGLSKVILDQLPETPPEWRDRLRNMSREHYRDGTIRAAQATPFERIIKQVRQKTTMATFQIWHEGMMDREALEALVDQLPEDIALSIKVSPLGGWNEVLSEKWRAEDLFENCKDLIVIMDGDRGRDLKKPSRPIKTDKEMKLFLKKLRHAGIECHILERYGFENYFPQHAFESVLGNKVNVRFPLNECEKVETQLAGFGYSKKQNGNLAKVTLLADLSGMDLGIILADIKARVEFL